MWDILDIEPTKDKKLIKKAYARQLKNTSPEDNPEGFQMLRDAYENGLKYSNVSSSIERPEKNINTSSLTFEDIEKELNKFSIATPLEEWEVFFSKSRSLNIEDKQQFEAILAQYLAYNCNSQGIIFAEEYPVIFFDLIDQYFHWRDDEMHIEKFIGSTSQYYLLLDCLQKVDKPTQSELIQDLIPLFINPNINTRRSKWGRLIRKTTLLSKKERYKMSERVFEVLVKHSTLPQFSILPEGLNALDRLFGWTYPKAPDKTPWIKPQLKKKLNDQTAFLEKKLYEARRESQRSGTFPLTLVEYRKSNYQWFGELLVCAFVINYLIKIIIRNFF